MRIFTAHNRKVIITGTNGMLGKDVAAILEGEELIIFGLNRHVDRLPVSINQAAVDLTDYAAVRKTLENIDPEIIIHCAANVDLDDCERDKEYANRLNAGATGILASYKPGSVRFVYISTDSVFDGRKGDYSENDRPNPLNYYAMTKLEGERLALKQNPAALVIRTNIYGFRLFGNNKPLAEWAIESLKEGMAINGFSDVFFNPVYTKQLARIIKRLLSSEGYSGVLNVGGNEYLSKYDFLLRIARLFDFPESLIKNTSIEEGGLSTKRPRNTTLNINRFKSMFKEGPLLSEGLSELKKDYLSLARCGYGKD